MSSTAARLALLFALIGLGSSSASAVIHYRLLADPFYQSVCDVSATVNCTAVYSSQYGSIAGVSVAAVGVIWFALATLLSVAAIRGSDPVRQSVGEYLFAWSTVSLAAVFYLGYASFVILNMVCVFCVVTYIAVASVFLVSGTASTMSLLAVPGRLAADLRRLAATPAALAVAVTFVAASIAMLVFFPRESRPSGLADAAGRPSAGGSGTTASGSAPEGFEQWFASLPRVSLDEPAGGADVVVVKFNDYQCPPCRQTYFEYQSVFARYETTHPGRVRYVSLDFPLESECNALVRNDLHPAACEAAVAVRLARERGRASELEHWLFENQGTMTPEMVARGARDVAGVTDYAARYEQTLEAVKADAQRGIEIGARSTPTFVINGVMLAGGVPPAIFDLIIARELERAASRANP